MRNDIILMRYNIDQDKYEIIFSNLDMIISIPYSSSYIKDDGIYDLERSGTLSSFCFNILSRNSIFKKIQTTDDIFYYNEKEVNRYSVSVCGIGPTGFRSVSLMRDNMLIFPYKSTHPAIINAIKDLKQTITTKNKGF